jgi:mannitol/fructose-specific phosphotransferase system IIA component (Ntr-type)
MLGNEMDLNDFLGPNPLIIELKALDRWQAIDELVHALSLREKIKSADSLAITEAIKKRERSMSTGIGFGIGIPHASSELVSDVVNVIGRSKNGIQFDTIDGKPVLLVLLFLVPKGQFQKHLHNLSDLAKMLHKPEFRDRLGL